jgi:hypothetical protein
MKTKYHVRFFSRIAHLDTDLELVDVIKRSTAKGALHSATTKRIFADVNKTDHPRLYQRKNTDHSRSLAVGHLKSTLCEAFIKDAYDDVTQYMAEILEAAARNGLDPKRLIGEHNVSFDANELLALGGWSNVVHHVARSVFRKLESEQSTKSLLQKMNTKLNLGINQNTIAEAVPYFEIRHLLVHADGIADKTFCKTYPKFNFVGNAKIPLSYTLVDDARQAICALISEFDQKIVENKVVSASDLQP